MSMGVDVPGVVGLIEDYVNRPSDANGGPANSATATRQQNILRQFGVDLTKKAREGKIDPVIGRNKEISRAITILSRRRKNNPLLIGEPGVGKTAVVEGLALRVANGNVPTYFRDLSIVQIDLASVIAGTKYRGEFEDRMKRIISAVKK